VKIAGKEQFTVGQDLALTPGQVIYRNDLIELIQYAPAAEQVHAVPMLIIPPWINKYYIMDVRPGRSMVEYLAQQGFTVFLMSWRNPTPAMQDLSMEDYLRLGPLSALEVVQAISGSSRVNWIGYCLGGTLLAITLAYLAAIGDDSTNCATFFTTLQDFSEVGETSLFVTPEWITEVERRMDDKGYLDGLELSSVFKLMRANDLIWGFVVNNYLLGQEPMPFDLLYWSVDRTRMPRAMHSFYLRNMYVENNLVQPGRLEFLGQGIDLGRVRCPSYVVATVEDYIVPWPAAHKAAALFSGPVRRVLSAGGHQTGIINPPSDRVFYLTNESDTADADADEWLQSATRHAGSWWPDWMAWLGEQSGEKQAPPSMGNEAYPPLAAAPGTYVLEE
ncbi:MAG: alpha/beta fold hydrolase, partial [Chloroflexi bacterium]|nr:alpha/beta fold hydrolase [Chloroflexota bacterium]